MPLLSSTAELERIVTDAQGVVYYGAHTLSELVEPYKCPTLSKNGCTILCSFDRTSTCLVNNAPISLTDEYDGIQLDRSTEIALLWSSGGVKSILLNQWKSSMTENETVLTNTFVDSAALHCSLSQALRLHVYPYFRPVEIDPTAAATAKDGKNKGNTSTIKKARSPSPKGKQHSSPTKDSSVNKKSSSLHPPDITSEGLSSTEQKEEPQRPALQLQQLNPIIFGLPNLTFTP